MGGGIQGGRWEGDGVVVNLLTAFPAQLADLFHPSPSIGFSYTFL